MSGNGQSSQPRRHALRLPAGVVFVLLAVALVGAIVISSGSGYVRVPFGEVLRSIAGRLTGWKTWTAHAGGLAQTVVLDVRLPRILTAALVGAGLAASGAVFQGILLNPLADPYTLGVSAGAAFGASLALLLNFTQLGFWSVPAAAFCGAAVTLLAVIYLSAGDADFSSGSLILSGIIVAAILSAGVSLIKYLADDAVSIIIFWLMGSFAAKTWAEVGVTASAVAVGMIVFLIFGRDLDLLALGRRTAGSLGVSPRRTALALLAAASLVSAVCVAVSGIIGFVGLLVPHMIRTVTGPDHRWLITVSALAGGCLLLAADTVTRAVLPREIPIGVITALIGGPFFCYIFRRRQMRRME